MMKDARGGVCFEPSGPFGMPAIDRRSYRREPVLPPFVQIGRPAWRPADRFILRLVPVQSGFKGFSIGILSRP
jgi:hypothetical protein